MTKATFYVQFLPEFTYDNKVRRARALRMTKNPPVSIEGERVAVVKFVADLPDAIFDPFLAEVEVPSDHVEIAVATEPEEEAIPA